MGLFDRSFLITTGISAVICVAIIYYINTRMRELELALAKQNQVLSSFIANVQQEFRLSSSRQQMQPAVTSLASDEAIKFVENMEKEKSLNDKIVVSDSESDDESVSDSDDESVSDEDESENKLIICDLTKNTDDIKIIELNTTTQQSSVQRSSVEQVYTGSQVYVEQVFTPEKLSDNDESDDESDNDSDTEYEHITNTVQSEEINIDKMLVFLDNLPQEVNVHSEVQEDSINSVEKVENVEKNTKVNLNDLKVDDLRKLALDKQLTTKEESKKLKKNELLALLKK